MYKAILAFVLCALFPKKTQKALYGDLFDGMKKGLFDTPILKTYSFDEIHDAVEHAERSSGSGKNLAYQRMTIQVKIHIKHSTTQHHSYAYSCSFMHFQTVCIRHI